MVYATEVYATDNHINRVCKLYTLLVIELIHLNDYQDCFGRNTNEDDLYQDDISIGIRANKQHNGPVLVTTMVQRLELVFVQDNFMVLQLEI